jgi:hypothetical protein
MALKNHMQSFQRGQLTLLNLYSPQRVVNSTTQFLFRELIAKRV